VNKHSFLAVGMMSGTSLDGMDLVLCRFREKDNVWQFQILKAETTVYSGEWKDRFIQAAGLNAGDFMMLHNEYGRYIGRHVKQFLSGIPEHVDLVASHGHTIFHQPERRFTFQLGSRMDIACECGIRTVSDFRTTDVALGGQGAPLVPAGDRHLFGKYNYCLNLGGFANISNENDGQRIACDICPVNIVANTYSARFNQEFDRDGIYGRRGNLNMNLVEEWNNLSFYNRKGPKSLGREWVESEFMPVASKYEISPEDLLRSLYEHVAVQVSGYINSFGKGKVLVTGGGAFNSYLIELLREKSIAEIIIPGNDVVKYKEALIFAFLGLLRLQNMVNCYASVTGATSDSSSGVIYRA
jgi:anhydro-N-acetylmuramic acid kinase